MTRESAPPRVSAAGSFRHRFGDDPLVFGIAPGRVELLGNHTDYNGGLVLAAAVSRHTIVAGRPIEAKSARVLSHNFDDEDTFPLRTIPRGEDGSWPRYVRGVAWALQEAMGSFRSGFEASIAGNIPLGAGLSSSASLQASLAMFLLGAGLSPRGTAEPDDEARLELAKALQRSENAFVGVASGLLDQFTVLFGREGHAVMLDCQNLGHQRLPLGADPPAIVVCDSKTSRRLADGKYNLRRDECETVVAFYQRRHGVETVTWLRDVSLEQVEEDWDKLDPVGRLRARHVLTENIRVARGAEELLAGDVPAFGRLMSASHASSRDDFANSSAALDALIEAAEAAPGFLGGKLTGAGWAGCTVNLVEASEVDRFTEAVIERYSRRLGVTPEIHVCHAADGARAEVVPGSYLPT